LYLIVADDFTGANDTGLQLTRQGKATYVTFQPEAEVSEGVSLVINTESRNCSEEQAAVRIGKALAHLDLDSFDVVMKKIDSTLRGNIASEIKALDALYGSALVLVAPALPSLGRTTLNGRQYLNGLPILETEHAHDPIKAVSEDNLVSLLARAYDEPVAHISLGQIRSGSLRFPQARIVVCDAETDEDMRIVVRKARSLQTRILYVGTLALAGHLCEGENPSKPSLGLIASLNSVTAIQVRYAQKAGVASVVLPVADILSGKEKIETYIGQALEVLHRGNDLLVVSSGVLDPYSYDLSIAEGRLLGLSPEEVSLQTRALMSGVAKALVEAVEVAGVVVTGGDAAMALMEVLSARMAEIVGEVSLGIPLNRVVGGPHDRMKVVTKSGGFGQSDAILFALQYVKNR